MLTVQTKMPGKQRCTTRKRRVRHRGGTYILGTGVLDYMTGKFSPGKVKKDAAFLTGLMEAYLLTGIKSRKRH